MLAHVTSADLGQLCEVHQRGDVLERLPGDCHCSHCLGTLILAGLAQQSTAQQNRAQHTRDRTMSYSMALKGLPSMTSCAAIALRCSVASGDLCKVGWCEVVWGGCGVV